MIIFCLNRAKPWLELSFEFNRYSIKPFQRALVGFHKPWIHLSSKEFNWVSMPQIPFFVSEKILYCLFNFLFDRFSNRIYFAYVPKFTILDLVYHSLFSYQRKLHSVPNLIFVLNYYLFCHYCGVISDRITKMYFNYFNSKLWLYNLSRSINSILMWPSP